MKEYIPGGNSFEADTKLALVPYNEILEHYDNQD